MNGDGSLDIDIRHDAPAGENDEPGGCGTARGAAPLRPLAARSSPTSAATATARATPAGFGGCDCISPAPRRHTTRGCAGRSRPAGTRGRTDAATPRAHRRRDDHLRQGLRRPRVRRRSRRARRGCPATAARERAADRNPPRADPTRCAWHLHRQTDDPVQPIERLR